MDLKLVTGDIAAQQVDAIVINLFQGITSPAGATGAVDRALDGAISQLIADGDAKGKAGEFTLLHTLGKIPAKRVVVAGLGKADEFDADKIRAVSAETARFLQRHNCTRAATIVHGAGIGGIDPTAAAQALAEGAILGATPSTATRVRRMAAMTPSCKSCWWWSSTLPKSLRCNKA